MKYTLAFAAAISGALAATSKPFVPAYGGDETPSAATSAAPSTTPAAMTTPAPQGPATSTVFATDVETVFSCAETETECSFRSQGSTVVPSSSVFVPPPPAETTPAVSTSEVPPPPAETTPVAPPPAETTPAASSSVPAPPAETTPVVSSSAPAPPPAETTPVVSSSVPAPPPAQTTPAASSSMPAPPPAETTPVVSSSVPPPPPPPVTLVSTSVEVQECTPVTIVHTVTVVSQPPSVPTQAQMTPLVQTTPEALSKPFPSSAGGYGTAVMPTGTGNYAYAPTSAVSPPIQTGAANKVGISGVAIAAAAYLLF